MNNIYISLIVFLTLLITSCGGKSASKRVSQVQPNIFEHPSVASITEQIKAKPKDASLYFKRAKALRALQEDSLALTDLNKSIQLDSSKADYFSAIGELLFEHKDIDGSLHWFKRAIAIDPKDPVAHLKFAKMLMFINDNQKAFNEINVVLRKDPYNAEAYFLKGMVYKNMSDTNKAISSFQTSVQVDPAYQPSILQLAIIYAARKDTIALRYFDNAFATDTTQLVALHGKAMFYQEMGRMEKAKEMYRRCILRDPQYTDAFFNMGWILMHQDSLEKASKQFDYVTKIEPDNSEAYYNRAVCKELLKKTNEAVADYKQALTLEPNYEEAKEALIRINKK